MMRNKEIDIMKNTFERKYSTFEATNQELQNQLEFKERELLEEKIKREELENELKRMKDELEDFQIKSEMEVRYGIKDSQLQYEYMQERSLERTDSTFGFDNKSISKDQYVPGYYDKLSSDLCNLRNEINNLKSERTNGDTSRRQMESDRNYKQNVYQKYNNDNLDKYLFEKKNKKQERKVLVEKQPKKDSISSHVKISNYDSNFSEMDKLNELEQQLSEKGRFTQDQEWDSDAESYRHDLDPIDSEIDQQCFSHSENQSPNQETYARQISQRAKGKVLWNIANNMDANDELTKNSLVPNLNMEKVHVQNGHK